MKEERFRFVIEQLRHSRLRVGRVIDIDLPKTAYSVRPGSVLPIEEAMILHAAIYLIAPKLDRKLHKHVYSYRLQPDWERRVKRADSMFGEGNADDIPFLKNKTIRSFAIDEPWYQAWPEFDAEGVRAVHELGFRFLTKTDISAYFENIDLQLLESLLREWLPQEVTLVELIMRILNSWTRRTTAGVPIGRGIPQGNDISSFLGNLFLIPLDRALDAFSKSRGVTWFRYVDDVKVFTKTYDDARDAVFVINDALRHLHLNLQGSKTKILQGDTLEAELFDPELATVNDLISQMQPLVKAKAWDRKKMTLVIRRASPVASLFTRRLPDGVCDLDGRTSRLFRRTLTLYGMGRRPQLRRAAVEALKHLPDFRMLRSILQYLRKLEYSQHDLIVPELLAMIADGKLPFPYQVAAVLDALGDFHPSSTKEIASRMRGLVQDRRSHWYVRQKALEVISVWPYREHYVPVLFEAALGDEHPWVRRASMLLLARGTVEFVRQRVARLVYHADSEVSRIALYWQAHLSDPDAANKAITAMRHGDPTDAAFNRNIAKMYLLRCSHDERVGKRLHEHVELYRRSHSERIRWHVGNLCSQLGRWIHVPPASEVEAKPAGDKRKRRRTRSHR